MYNYSNVLLIVWLHYILQISSINGTMMANQISTVSSVRRQQTVITFDNGATWQNIAAPANIDGAATNCMLVRT